MMNHEEMLLKRRSIRNFLNKTVPNETLQELIKESTYAPSSGNEQPWKFIIVNDRLLMKKISNEAKENILKRIEINPNDYAKKYEKMLRNEKYNIFYNAPSLVFIIGEKNQKNMKINCALAASYLMMSATSRGLGTCWINFALAIESLETLNELGIPEDCEIVAPIIVGFPVEIPDLPIRKDPEILKII